MKGMGQKHRHTAMQQDLHKAQMLPNPSRIFCTTLCWLIAELQILFSPVLVLISAHINSYFNLLYLRESVLLRVKGHLPTDSS